MLHKNRVMRDLTVPKDLSWCNFPGKRHVLSKRRFSRIFLTAEGHRRLEPRTGSGSRLNTRQISAMATLAKWFSVRSRNARQNCEFARSPGGISSASSNGHGITSGKLIMRASDAVCKHQLSSGNSNAGPGVFEICTGNELSGFVSLSRTFLQIFPPRPLALSLP